MTNQQALALAVSIVGVEDIGEQQSRPLSPHAITALGQHLGHGQVLRESDVWQMQRYYSDPVYSTPISDDQRKRVADFSNLMIELGTRLLTMADGLGGVV